MVAGLTRSRRLRTRVWTGLVVAVVACALSAGPICADAKATLIVTRFGVAPSGEGVTAVGEALNALLVSRLSEVPGVKIVERERLQEALSEIRLAQEGVIDDATAKRLGRVLGADYMLSGEVKALGREVLVSVRLTDLETSQLFPDVLTLPADVEPGAAVERAAGRIEALLTRANSARASGQDRAFVNPAWADLSKPGVMVVLPESHKPRPRPEQPAATGLAAFIFVPDPAGETELARILLANGFTCVDRKVSQEARKTQQAWEKLRGNLKAIQELGLQEDADVVVLGEAFSEFAGESAGFVACRARVEVKAVDAKTGAILYTDGAEAGASDIAENIAGKKALRKAAQVVALDLAEALIKKWNPQESLEHALAKRELVVELRQVEDFAELVKVEQALKELEGTSDVNVGQLSDRVATINLTYTGSSWQLAKRLDELKDPDIIVLEVTEARVSLQVQ